MKIMVTAYLMKKGKQIGAYYKNIDISVVPYPGTTLILGVLDATRSGIGCSLKVEDLIWRETNETEKISAFGKVDVSSEDDLRCFERSSDWKKW